ncbi:MAG: FAD-dependent oxidoreductase, partial [FCB group bacterium]|nr:FAD-dependent oxidoreductase [FCB group bacterium]
MNEKLYHAQHTADLCVVGGGLAGTIAALAAARRGAKVVLIQDRPVLGGNASSEIRMWVRGAHGVENRETGILAEIEEENIYRNPNLAAPLWDSVLYGKVMAEKNITLLLNTSCLDATVGVDGKIQSAAAWQLNTYTFHTVSAKIFADCSGDSILAPLVGARYRVGREAEGEYGESLGRAIADSKTMGSSVLLQSRETDHAVKFIPPKWAYIYETDADFAKAIRQVTDKNVISENRDHNVGTSGGNLWWIEVGGDGDTLRDADANREDLLRIAFGIWDHIKNRGEHGRANWDLEWVGFLPGKRESRRYVGAHVLNEKDIRDGGTFGDTVAYGGWPMDDHNPRGFYANSEDDPPSRLVPTPSPYGIPYRALYSEDVPNLMFAGRNISASHVALSSTRVMGTCSLIGQATGTAAALCIERNILPGGLIPGGLTELLQQRLMDDGVFLPGFVRHVSQLTLSARLNVTDAERDILFNGVERPRPEGGQNFITLALGRRLVFDFGEKKLLGTLRIQFDRDYSRMSVSPNAKMRVFAQR